MKIVLFGATGNAGRSVLAEALTRGHEVISVSRHPEKIASHSAANWVQGDVSNPDNVAQIVRLGDAVISTVGPENMVDNPQILETALRAFLTGLERAGKSRLLVLGGTGTLEIAPGLLLMNTPDFPDFIKPVALAHWRALQILQQEAPPEIEWTYFSPGIPVDGKRTGKYRVGSNQVLVDGEGKPSLISWADMAVAMLDELENPQHLHQQITIAY